MDSRSSTTAFNTMYWIRLLSLVTVWGAGLALVIALFDQILSVVVALFLAICLNPPVTFVAKRVTRGNRLFATSIVYALLVLIGLFCILSVLPIFVRQVISLTESIPELYNRIAQSNSNLGRSLQELNLSQVIEDNRAQIIDTISVVGEGLVETIGAIFGSVIRFITILSFAFLMVVHAPYWRRVSLELIPQKNHKEVLAVASKMYRVATGYINGNLCISLIAGIATGIMLTILGVPNAVALAIIVAIVDLLPSIGATLAGIIVVSLTLLLTGIGDAVVMTLFFLAYQAIENMTLQPMVYSKALKVQSLVILVAVFLIGSLFGIVGALLAIPISACAQILVRHYLNKRTQPTHQKRSTRGRTIAAQRT